VVIVKGVGYEREMPGHGFCALGVALDDPPNESGCETKLATEQSVQHFHFTSVEILFAVNH
jgi:hypothetical protein